MDMSIDKKKVVERLKQTGGKKKYTFALTESLMNEFQSECQKLGIDYGPTIEDLIKDFLGYYPESGKKK